MTDSKEPRQAVLVACKVPHQPVYNEACAISQRHEFYPSFRVEISNRSVIVDNINPKSYGFHLTLRCDTKVFEMGLGPPGTKSEHLHWTLNKKAEEIGDGLFLCQSNDCWSVVSIQK